MHGSSPVFIDTLLPIFSQSKPHSGCTFGDILIPSWYFVPIAEKYSKIKNFTKHDFSGAYSSHWAKKTNSIFWRGSSTGSALDEISAIETNHRIRLVRFMNDCVKNVHCNITDVSFSAIIQCKDVICKRIKKEVPVKPRISFREMIKHKILIDIDGNSFSVRFFHFLLESKSILLKSGIFMDWYTGLFQPNQHYLPLDLEFSQFNAHINWILNHDQEALQMASDTHTLAQKHLRLEDMQCYLLRVFLEWHNLLNYDKQSTV